jgi:hypothetical protein
MSKLLVEKGKPAILTNAGKPPRHLPGTPHSSERGAKVAPNAGDCQG